jgi:hypothetical protein
MKKTDSRAMRSLTHFMCVAGTTLMLSSCGQGSESSAESDVQNTDGPGQGCGTDPYGQPHSCWQAPTTPAPEVTPAAQTVAPAPVAAPAPSQAGPVGAFGNTQGDAFDDTPLPANPGECGIHQVVTGVQFDAHGNPIPETQAQREARLRNRSPLTMEQAWAACKGQLGSGGAGSSGAGN